MKPPLLLTPCWLFQLPHTFSREARYTLYRILFLYFNLNIPTPRSQAIIWIRFHFHIFRNLILFTLHQTGPVFWSPRIWNTDDHTHTPAFVQNPSHPALIFPSPPFPDPPNGLPSSLGAHDVMEKWNTYCCRISKTSSTLSSFSDYCPLHSNNLIMMMSSCQGANCSRLYGVCVYHSDCPVVNGVERGECNSTLSNHNHKTPLWD